MRVYLLGYMGSGKTTVGRKLATKAGYSFLDLDTEIEKYKGKRITDIFNEESEVAFREAEKTCLHKTLSSDNVIVSTGGGTACFFDNINWMNEHGITIYLRMTAGSLYHRLGPGKHKRPLLKNLNDIDLMEFIMKQLPEREHYYLQSKHIISGQSVKPEDLLKFIQEETKI